MKQKISILVSTVDNHLAENQNFFEHIDFEICEVIVIQQMIKTDVPLKLNNPSKVFSYKEKGLSKSRNLAMEKASCDIALITDDDVSFVKGFEQKIIEAYSKYTDAYLISFQVLSTESGFFKSYRENSFKHNFRSVLKISSIEVSLNLAKFKTRKLFDERFGLGGEYPGGEEVIMSLDLFRENKAMYFVADPIVMHPIESSGKVYSVESTYTRGVIYRRCFGAKSFLFSLAFALKKYGEYKQKLGFFSFLFSMWRGNLKSLK